MWLSEISPSTLGFSFDSLPLSQWYCGSPTRRQAVYYLEWLALHEPYVALWAWHGTMPLPCDVHYQPLISSLQWFRAQSNHQFDMRADAQVGKVKV
jgi:hypothetical protein